MRNVALISSLFTLNTAQSATPPLAGDVASKHVEVVVSHCGEDISWAAELVRKHPTTTLSVYTKGANPVPETVAMLPNIGRQAHTYLHHIVENYYNLAPWTIFTTGNMLEQDNFDESFEAFRNGKDSLFSISEAVHLPRGVTIKASEIRGNNECPAGGANGWQDWTFDHDGFYHQLAARMQNFYRRAVLNQPLLKSEAMRSFTLGYAPSAAFALSSSRIRSRPMKYYTRLMAEVSDHSNPVESSFLNAAWYDVFHPENTQIEQPLCQFPPIPPELGVEIEETVDLIERRLDNDANASSTTMTTSTLPTTTTPSTSTTPSTTSSSTSQQSSSSSTTTEAVPNTTTTEALPEDEEQEEEENSSFAASLSRAVVVLMAALAVLS